MGSRRGNIRELLPLREYGDRADGSGKIGIRVSSTVVGEVRLSLSLPGVFANTLFGCVQSMGS